MRFPNADMAAKFNKEKLVWVGLEAKVETKTGAKLVTMHRSFANIRPAYNTSGMLDANDGWVVTRATFEDLHYFSNIDEAKLYVQALFALEST